MWDLSIDAEDESRILYTKMEQANTFSNSKDGQLHNGLYNLVSRNHVLYGNQYYNLTSARKPQSLDDKSSTFTIELRRQADICIGSF